ncbi:MAG TPA: hypothetical protein VIM11_27955 [Tepidisphaeraceae bacterium]
MVRRKFTIVYVVSLLGCLLWAWSQLAFMSVWVGTSPKPTSDGYQGIVHWEFCFGNGLIYVERAFHESRNSEYLANVSQSGTSSDPPFSGAETIFGFGFHRERLQDNLRRYRIVYVVLPLWPFLLVMIVPLLRFFRWVREPWIRRVEPGLCRCCSYDLTGNVSGVCPECGTAVKA